MSSEEDGCKPGSPRSPDDVDDETLSFEIAKKVLEKTIKEDLGAVAQCPAIQSGLLLRHVRCVYRELTSGLTTSEVNVARAQFKIDVLHDQYNAFLTRAKREDVLRALGRFNKAYDAFRRLSLEILGKGTRIKVVAKTTESSCNSPPEEMSELLDDQEEEAEHPKEPCENSLCFCCDC